jgi:bacillithiol biosynthesis cysteine-adding enzyme BshC
MTRILQTVQYNRFFTDYITDSPTAGQFLPTPGNVDWEKIIAKCTRMLELHPQLRAELVAQNSGLRGEAEKKSCELAAQEKTLFVVTGQQLGLLATPMYTIYKIISAIKLAAKLSRQFAGHHFVPVFWMETEDHDFAEVNHFGIWDKGQQPLTLTYKGTNHGKRALRNYKLEPAITAVLTELRGALLQTEFSEDLFNIIEAAHQPGAGWQQASKALFSEIFNGSGLLFFEPGTETVKRLSAPFLSRFARESAHHYRILHQQSTALLVTGYDNQVSVLDGRSFIHFSDAEGQRHHLQRDGNRLSSDGKSWHEFSYWEQEFAARPGDLSSTVISRPLLQSWLLPTVAYVAGPAEIAYWAQLYPLFEKLGMAPPVVWPRISATIVEKRIERAAGKMGIELSTVEKSFEDFVDNQFRHQLQANGPSPFETARAIISTEFERINAFLKSLDPTLLPVAEKTIAKMESGLDQLESRGLRSLEQRDLITRNNLTLIHHSLFPNEKPQERFVSPVYFANKYGPDFYRVLFEQLNVEIFNNQLLQLY